MRVLFIVPYPSAGASNRLRVEQYLPYLKINGIEYKVRHFVSGAFYNILYRDGYYFLKLFYFTISTFNRLIDVVLAFKYDVIFIHREAYPVGPPLFEYIFFKLNKPIIYDFDDAIFLPNTSKVNSFMERFKNPKKIIKIIKLSSCIVAGNEYLGDFALNYNSNVVLLPTCIDTDKYTVRKVKKSDSEKILIGWIGSETTKKFLLGLENALSTLKRKYWNLEFYVIGAEYKSENLGRLYSMPWSLDAELDVLQLIDIGVMPLPDNEWTKGKCGFKAILYMSVGMPCVCSPVGVNKKLISEGINGFLANTDKEWIEKLSSLIEDSNLREKIGMAGRLTVEEKYSIKINAPKFLDIIKTTYAKRAGG